MNYPKFLGETLQFDPFQKPPRLEFALKHQQATQCGFIPENADFCQCCGNAIPTKIISLSIKIIDLSFLGQGVPLFFNHTTLIILLHFLLFFIFTAPNVIQNIQVNDCISPNNYALTLWQNEGCQDNCPLNHKDYQIFENYFQECNSICQHYLDICIISQTSSISYINKQNNNEGKLIQSSLLLCSILILKVSLVLIRERQRKLEYQIDKDLLSPSDFTAILNYLPSNNYTEKELKQALEDYCKEFDTKNNYEVVKINLAYNISQFIDQGREKLKLEKIIEQNNLGSSQSLKIQSKIQEIQKNQQLIEYQIENGCYTQTTSIAFVTFQTKQQLQNLLAHTKLSYWETWMLSIKSFFNKKDIRGFYFKGQLININRAPEPDDVFWENCGVDEKSQKKRRVLSFFVILILLGFSFGILYGLNEFQNRYLKSEADQIITKTMISFSKSLIVTIVDGLIYYFITLLADQERHVTKTLLDASISKKLTYVQFINSCLLLIFISIIGTYNQSSDLSNDQLNKLSLQQQGGIADDIVYVSGANALLKPLSAYFNPLYYINKIRQKRIEKQKDLNQFEANKIFEGPQVQFYDQYSHLCKTTWMSLFFAPLAPISVFFGLIGLIAFYWIQKYLLLRRNSRPPFQSSHLDRDMLYLMDLSPILFSIMQFWIDSVFDSNQLCQTVSLASLIIACSEIIFPTYRLHRMIFKDEYEEEELVRYEDVYLKLPTDYDRMNPLTQQAAMQELVQNKLKQKKQPINLQLSQNLFASKGKRNQALQDLIHKGYKDPKQVRMKILKQKLKLVVKMRILQNIKPLVVKDQIKEFSQELNFVEKVESFKSSHISSPTYLKTPEYNFSTFINIQPQHHQQSEIEVNSLFSQQPRCSYQDTPKYYFSTQKNSFFKSIVAKINIKNQ